jgi:hypothetical protein
MEVSNVDVKLIKKDEIQISATGFCVLQSFVYKLIHIHVPQQGTFLGTE